MQDDPPAIPVPPRRLGQMVVSVADLAGTFVFAVEGALEAIQARFDPIGVLALAFAVALGGGIIRDVLLRLQPAAISGSRYTAIVLVAASAAWLAGGPRMLATGWVVTTLDAAGLGLFAVAATEKAVEADVRPLPAIFIGTIGSVGGGMIRDILLNRTPRVLDTDIYATAAILAAAIVVAGRARGLNPRATALVAGLACFALRMGAVICGWQLPHASR